MGIPARVCVLVVPMPMVIHLLVKALSAAPAKRNIVPLGKLRHRARWWARCIMLGAGFTRKKLYFHHQGQFCLQVPQWCWGTFGLETMGGDLGVTTTLQVSAPSSCLSPSALGFAIAAAAVGHLGRWGPGPPWPWQHRTGQGSSFIQGGESSSVANNLISVSCLAMEKSHVVRGSKNRLSKTSNHICRC